MCRPFDEEGSFRAVPTNSRAALSETGRSHLSPSTIDHPGSAYRASVADPACPAPIVSTAQWLPPYPQASERSLTSISLPQESPKLGLVTQPDLKPEARALIAPKHRLVQPLPRRGSPSYPAYMAPPPRHTYSFHQPVDPSLSLLTTPKPPTPPEAYLNLPSSADESDTPILLTPLFSSPFEESQSEYREQSTTSEANQYSQEVFQFPSSSPVFSEFSADAHESYFIPATINPAFISSRARTVEMDPESESDYAESSSSIPVARASEVPARGRTSLHKIGRGRGARGGRGKPIKAMKERLPIVLAEMSTEPDCALDQTRADPHAPLSKRNIRLPKRYRPPDKAGSTTRARPMSITYTDKSSQTERIVGEPMVDGKELWSQWDQTLLQFKTEFCALTSCADPGVAAQVFGHPGFVRLEAAMNNFRKGLESRLIAASPSLQSTMELNVDHIIKHDVHRDQGGAETPSGNTKTRKSPPQVVVQATSTLDDVAESSRLRDTLTDRGNRLGEDDCLTPESPSKTTSVSYHNEEAGPLGVNSPCFVPDRNFHLPGLEETQSLCSLSATTPDTILQTPSPTLTDISELPALGLILNPDTDAQASVPAPYDEISEKGDEQSCFDVIAAQPTKLVLSTARSRIVSTTSSGRSTPVDNPRRPSPEGRSSSPVGKVYKHGRSRKPVVLLRSARRRALQSESSIPDPPQRVSRSLRPSLNLSLTPPKRGRSPAKTVRHSSPPAVPGKISRQEHLALVVNDEAIPCERLSPSSTSSILSPPPPDNNTRDHLTNPNAFSNWPSPISLHPDQHSVGAIDLPEEEELDCIELYDPHSSPASISAPPKTLRYHNKSGITSKKRPRSTSMSHLSEASEQDEDAFPTPGSLPDRMSLLPVMRGRKLRWSRGRG